MVGMKPAFHCQNRSFSWKIGVLWQICPFWINLDEDSLHRGRSNRSWNSPFVTIVARTWRGESLLSHPGPRGSNGTRVCLGVSRALPGWNYDIKYKWLTNFLLIISSPASLIFCELPRFHVGHANPVGTCPFKQYSCNHNYSVCHFLGLSSCSPYVMAQVQFTG